jgi:hypothetical protein
MVGVFIALFVYCGGWSRDITSSLYFEKYQEIPYNEVNDVTVFHLGLHHTS